MPDDPDAHGKSSPHTGGTVAVIVVDHGTRRLEANAGFEEFVRASADRLPYPIVEPAHMELAEPSIATAFSRCVAAPLGPDPRLVDLAGARLAHCLAHVDGRAGECAACVGTGRCTLR
jgi:sirohydrochlorin ferrochelatase